MRSKPTKSPKAQGTMKRKRSELSSSSEGTEPSDVRIRRRGRRKVIKPFKADEDGESEPEVSQDKIPHHASSSSASKVKAKDEGKFVSRSCPSPIDLTKDSANDSTMSEAEIVEEPTTNPGSFLVKWGVNANSWVRDNGPDWVYWTLHTADYRDHREFKDDAQAYLEFLEENPGAAVVAFGKKHRGKRLDECRDLPWVRWCCEQSWAKSHFPRWRALALKWLKTRDRHIENVQRDIRQRLTRCDDIPPPQDDDDDDLSDHIVPDDYEDDVADIQVDINGIYREMEGFILPDGEGEEEVDDGLPTDEASAKETNSVNSDESDRNDCSEDEETAESTPDDYDEDEQLSSASSKAIESESDMEYGAVKFRPRKNSRTVRRVDESEGEGDTEIDLLLVEEPRYSPPPSASIKPKREKALTNRHRSTPIATSSKMKVEDTAEQFDRDSTLSEGEDEETCIDDPGSFLVKWGVNEDKWIRENGPDWVEWTLRKADYRDRRPQEFKDDAEAYGDTWRKTQGLR
ncbi:hypothetical protein JAAARDRAFT_57983 [Jaapia argillacea MUCL 33604]|uniref:Uncharacterized protein n=1 Tax=Jaapia argillacea MUCL 33604 TaxID=933084 RepID=A0A067Q6N2_9AGAM|nr:hypothetical protein JAAARDRAFT_57983 [Jaapia argillacea MUCL 33604]